MARLNFRGGGKYGMNQKHAAYRGHMIWQDIGFAGTKSYTIDNATQPRFQTPRDAKAAIDAMVAAKNPEHVTMPYSFQFKDLPIGATFRFSGSERLAGSGAFMGQSTYRKTGPRSYVPADAEAAEADLRKMYSGYPDILKKLKGAALRKAITLKVGSTHAQVERQNAGPRSIRKSKKELKKRGWFISKGQASRGASVKNPGGYESIRAGSRVTIVNRFGQQSSGRAVMPGPGGWVLNMGGRHGTPGIATPDNTVKVSGGHQAKYYPGLGPERNPSKDYKAYPNALLRQMLDSPHVSAAEKRAITRLLEKRKNPAAVVSTYQLRAGDGSGRPVRQATQVTIGGRTVRFMERMSKREAIRQAERFLEREGLEVGQKANPQQMVFRDRAAALRYANAQGIRKFKLEKIQRAS